MTRTWLLLAACALGCLAHPGVVRACAACGCGDPTLTSMGAEKPYAGRLRAGVEVSTRSDVVGEPHVDQVRLRELRTSAQVAWAPVAWLVAGVTVPVLWRTAEYVNLAKRSTFGLGDIELRSKFFVFQEREFAPKHLISVTGGVKLATARRERGSDGMLLPPELQPGSGSFDPLLAASYAYFPYPWSLYSSVQATYPTGGNDGSRASPSARTTVTAQYQIINALALRLGLDTRTDGKAREGGRTERDSGGFLALVSPELLVSPTEDLLLYAYVRVPVFNRLTGYHDEGVFAGAGIAYDF